MHSFHLFIIRAARLNAFCGLQGKANAVLRRIPAGAYAVVMVLAYVKLLHELGKLPACWELVNLMEQLDIC